MRTMNIIKSDHHEIYSIKMNKIALSANDDKRQIVADKVHPLGLRENNLKLRMRYTDEQVGKYLHFLKPGSIEIQDQERKKPEKVRCKICQSDEFFGKTGYNILEKCGMSRGHALGVF